MKNYQFSRRAPTVLRARHRVRIARCRRQPGLIRGWETCAGFEPGHRIGAHVHCVRMRLLLCLNFHPLLCARDQRTEPRGH